MILENRPCWLYFDLEFSLESNPLLKPKVVMHAFRKTLETFCKDMLGMTLDTTKMLELESSTPKKFSRHVIVKALGEYPDGDDGGGVQRALAFANNAQTGLLVNHLVKYADAHRDESWSLSRYLFVEPPGRDERERQVCVIDESVYLVGDWNMTFMNFHSVGNVIIPIDEYFSEGFVETTNQV